MAGTRAFSSLWRTVRRRSVGLACVSSPTTLRQAMVIGGLGAAMLASVHAEMPSCSGTAQCDARYSPAYHGATTFEFDVPLDAERFGQLPAVSTASSYSCASYKANFPIEDKFEVKSTADGDVFALVLDGHGGWQVSEYARKVLIENVEKELKHWEALKVKEKEQAPQDEHLKAAEVRAAIMNGYTRTDRELMAQVSGAFKLGFGAVGRCGSCALMAYVHGKTLFVANAGDIRAVIGRAIVDDPARQVEAIPMSTDHNAMAKAEQQKLEREHPGEENVFVCRHPDSCYVKGALQPTRALGDFALKYSEFNGPPYVNGDRSAGRHIPAPYTPPYITALPEIKSRKLDAQDKFIVIGSDGVWDYLSNEEAVEIVQEQMEQGHRERAGRAIVEKVLEKAAVRYDMTLAEILSLPPGGHRRRRHDDTTVIVLFFD